jgi:four helix bundle protein
MNHMKYFRTYALALDFHKATTLVNLKEPLRTQFERASLSVLLNIAEGYGKLTTRDKRKFYSISLGSLREVQCILEIVDHKKLQTQADRLGAHLYKLVQNPGGIRT